MERFPTDVVTDILSRLPVEPLLRFRCVSKPWCALIDSPDFTKLHLKRSSETRNNRFLILRDQFQHLYSLSLYSLDAAVEVDHPLRKCNEFGPEVLGSCNGLLLLRDSDAGDVAIWNPSTRKGRKLPSSGTEPPISFHIVISHGLGYDSVNDDYKVLHVVQLYGKYCEVQLYSLKSNSWKKIRDFPYCLPYGECGGTFASGALHWVVTQNTQARQRFIAGFDLATEEYRTLPLPNFGVKEEFDMSVVAFEGCLCLMRSNHVGRGLDVWVMKEYGVRVSWTKLFSVAQPKHIKAFSLLVPLAFSKDGNKVLLGQDSQKFIWFDLKSNVVQAIKVRGLPRLFHEEFCVQSLVSVGVGAQSYKKKKQPREESKEKKQEKIVKKRDGFLTVGFKLKL